MGKRIEDLNLDDSPHDSRDTEWGEFLTRIEELLPDYQWAKETLEGIYNTVEKTERVTPGQKTAVDNIEAGGHKRRGHGGWR